MNVTTLIDQHISEIENQLAALKYARDAIRGVSAEGGRRSGGGKRRLSAVGRARIAAAAKKRWAEYRKAKAKN